MPKPEDLGRVDSVVLPPPAHIEPTKKTDSVVTHISACEDVIAPVTAFLGVTAAAGEAAKYTMTSASASVTFFQPLETIKKLLECVAHGEQKEAQKILLRQPELLAQRGDVIDYSGRKFSNISPWEYMLWARDTRHMGRMMLDCIPNTDAGDTIRRELLAQYDSADTHYDFTVIKAIDEYLTLCERQGEKNPSYRESQTLLKSLMKIGIEQQKMPAHLFHEYCNPSSSFLMNLNFKFGFKEDSLERTDRFFNHTTGKYEHLLSTGSIHAGLGVEFALMQNWTSCDAVGLNKESDLDYVYTQLKALTLLQKARKEDAEELRKILQASLVLAPSAPPIETKGMG